jgi:hypothetical protein
VAGIYLNRNTIEVLRHDFIVFTATRSCSALARGYFFGSSDSGCGKSAFCPLRLFTACRRMYSICPFTLRSSACAQLSRSSQSAGSIRRRNDFRSAIVTSQLSSLLYRQQCLTSFCSVLCVEQHCLPWIFCCSTALSRTGWSRHLCLRPGCSFLAALAAAAKLMCTACRCSPPDALLIRRTALPSDCLPWRHGAHRPV